MIIQCAECGCDMERRGNNHERCSSCSAAAHKVYMRAYSKEYRQRPHVKRARAAFNKSPEEKHYQRQYAQRGYVKAKKRAYMRRPDIKAREKARRG